MTTKPDYDVAIVGYGPVGAGAALLLARAGLRVAVLERTTGVVELPRAVNLDGEVVRAFQQTGLGDEVASILQEWRPGESVAFTDSARKPYFTMPMPRPAESLNGWQDFSFFDQPEFEHLVRQLVGKEQGADVRLGHEVTDIQQGPDGVVLRARDLESGNEVELSAAYVIGCDGAASFVRRHLGIEWQSLGYDQDWLVVDIVLKPGAELTNLTMQVCDPARITTYVCTKDPYRRWEFRMLPGETREQMEKPETVRALLDDWLPADQYTLRRSAVYQFHAATASRWQEGRVFLAGDAAHQTPPFLGQGLNAGFRDVINLAWKLPLVLSGSCDPSLLETYAAERDAHARDLVEWAVAVGRLMESLAATEAGEAPPPSEEEQRSGYGQGRSAPPLRDGVLIRSQVSDDGATGYLLRQPKVRTAEGRECRLDELIGPGFGVIGRDAAALALSDPSRSFLGRMGIRPVSLEGVEVCEGRLDPLFERHAAAIVRPDRYVFGVTDDAHSLDQLIGALEEKLTLRS